MTVQKNIASIADARCMLHVCTTSKLNWVGIMEMKFAFHQVAKTEPLRGLPVATGTHTRFTEDGEQVVSPPRTLLRGVPAASGSHLHFDK
jgi:hypothetical protein